MTLTGDFNGDNYLTRKLMICKRGGFQVNLKRLNPLKKGWKNFMISGKFLEKKI